MQVGEKSPDVRLSVLELQMGRLVSDAESEKRTRAQANSDIYGKLDRIQDSQEHMAERFRDAQDKQNKILYSMLGGLAVLEVLIQFIRH